jgi:Carbohydrate esterase, sialic acid-specific acetylesterase
MMMRGLLVVCLSLGVTSVTFARGKVKVFILAGQSNMEGKAAATTLEPVLRDARTRERFEHLKKDGQWSVRQDVRVTFLDRKDTPVSPLYGPLTVGFGSPRRVRGTDGKNKLVPGIGPELGIGWVLGEHFDEPVLLIKAAWGGRAVKHTFRPPSAPPGEEELKQQLATIKKKNPDMTLEKLKASYGSDYRKIIEETNKVLKDINKYVPDHDQAQGYEITGFIWFQGWNDAIGSGNPDYVKQMAHFIRDIRRDLKSPNLPFVIGELGTDGPRADGWIATFRKQQAAIAALPEFKKNVRLARTAQFWPNPPDLSREWKEFRAAARKNEQKGKDDSTRVPPGEFYLRNWVLKYKDKLAYTSDKRYHYLGSGRCYYEMGEAMGKAMLELIK